MFINFLQIILLLISVLTIMINIGAAEYSKEVLKLSEKQYDVFKEGKPYIPNCYLFSDYQLTYGLGIETPIDSSVLLLPNDNRMNLGIECSPALISADFVTQQRKFKELQNKNNLMLSNLISNQKTTIYINGKNIQLVPDQNSSGYLND